MTRTEFQQLAEVRLREAEALLAAGLWDGAYYLAGYAVECGLKACIANLFKAETFPEKSFSSACYTHTLDDLVKLACLTSVRQTDEALDPVFAKNWQITKDWNETRRYERIVQMRAETLLAAITDPKCGVMQWVRRNW